MNTSTGTVELYCVIYELDFNDKARLDRLEGLGGGYIEQLMSVGSGGRTFNPSIYVAASTHIDPTLAPYRWYKEMVILGANYHRMPDSYIQSIQATDSIPDPDLARAAQNEKILSAMRKINQANGCPVT